MIWFLTITLLVVYLLGMTLMEEFLEESMPDECFNQPSKKKVFTYLWPVMVLIAVVGHYIIVVVMKDDK